MNEDSKKTWGKKIAVAIIHGAGKQEKNFADVLIKTIGEEFVKLLKDVEAKQYLEFKPIWWAPILEKREKNLLEKMHDYINRANLSTFYYLSKILWWFRDFIVSYFGDVVAYQPSYTDTSTVYDEVHEQVAKSLKELATASGGNAPLCIISHSLGTIIASNYFYDISQPHLELIPNNVKEVIGKSPSPLEKGETLMLFYTLGCPIALWNLRFSTFNKPISIPAKEVAQFVPPVVGEWINFYERHDPFSFPLNPIPSYKNVCDCEVKNGTFITHMTPCCHNYYFTNTKIALCIAEGLAKTWWSINGQAFKSPKRTCSFSDKECNRSIA